MSREVTDKFWQVKKILKENAESIEKLATAQHKKLLGGERFKSEFITKYQKWHKKIINELANNLNYSKFNEGVKLFNELGEEIAQQAASDGFSMEEAVDGIIFLKQSTWKKLEEKGVIDKLTKEDFYNLSQLLGTYCDVIASKIAFTFHKERMSIENNLQFLAEAGKILYSSLDYQTTLNSVATLAIPQIADWCTIDILDEKGELQLVALAHKDPRKVTWARRLRKERPPNMAEKTGLGKVVRTGKPELYPVIDEKVLMETTSNNEEIEIIKRLKLTSAMIVPIFSQHKPIGAISFISTENKRHYTQADLVMAQELANRASIAIENARLFEGSKQAVSLRDDFISVASHELKTPVTSVKLFIEILKKHSQELGDETAVTHLLKMERQLNKLTELIYDLLNISKIQAGKIEFNFSKFDFDKSVKEIVDILQHTSTKHTIEVVGTTNKKVIGDEERIEQVLTNLISNAIKYSPKSNKVLVKLSSKDSKVQVDVRDFGIGIEKKHLTRIFERFYRVYDTKDKTFPGLGIGLYISSEIVKRHGGKLQVNSEPGGGSTFSFSLPVDQKGNK